MTTQESDNLYKILRQARVDAEMTQSALATAVGCKQSAISMMEAGRREAISHETLVKLCEILKVELPDSMKESNAAVVVPLMSGSGVAVCSNFNCPSNMPFLIGEEVRFLPMGNVGHGKHCIFCGELLTKTCQRCHAPIHAGGGCCTSCGAQHVEYPDGYAEDINVWIAGRMDVISTLGRFLAMKSES